MLSYSSLNISHSHLIAIVQLFVTFKGLTEQITSTRRLDLSSQMIRRQTIDQACRFSTVLAITQSDISDFCAPEMDIVEFYSKSWHIGLSIGLLLL